MDGNLLRVCYLYACWFQSESGPKVQDDVHCKDSVYDMVEDLVSKHLKNRWLKCNVDWNREAIPDWDYHYHKIPSQLEFLIPSKD